ncbi:conserved Plasmodium protein, unknown function [Plasmodium gallinaceum]|uniref:Uncharacterized protein n=1 Tax=Plasmodium gallinaceum TaxID=5849 RepID=A0A1J1GWT4_PLAGA|nr:conserved Plasmodium protein, unknown function [Plasmodium gallinaceum]CRG96900.1 conserved Plasmodium protein, unknown function [Plasmodium gallinaceum]
MLGETSEHINISEDEKKYINIIKIIQLREQYKVKSMNNSDIYNCLVESLSSSNINNKIKQKTLKYDYVDLERENHIFSSSINKINNISNNILYGSNSFDFSNNYLKRYYLSNSSNNSDKIYKKSNNENLIKNKYIKGKKNKYFKSMSENDNSFIKNENLYPIIRMKSSNILNFSKDTYDKSFSIFNENLYPLKNYTYTSITRKDENICNEFYEKSYTTVYSKYNTFKKKKLIKSKTFKIEKKKKNYYKQKIKNFSNIYYKKIKGKEKEEKQKDNLKDKKKKNSNRDIFFNHMFKSSSICESLSASKIKYLKEEGNLNNEEHDREEYIKCIFLSIKRQQKKNDFLEKNAEHMLDLIELLLYKRMKEMFLFKKKICSKDKYKSLFPNIFYFNNNDDLIEAIDKKLRFLPKIPAKENLTSYCGPSSFEIFGKYYSSYKYDYKLIKVDVKLYKYSEIFNNANKFCNKELKYKNYFELLNNYKIKENDLNQNVRKAKKINIPKKNILSFCNYIYKVNSNKKEIGNVKKKETCYIKVKEIPNELIKVLKFKNITIR